MDYPASGDGASSVAAKLAATDACALPRVEIVEERRRSHVAAFRAWVVAEASVPGARVEELARRHGICTSLVYRWRRAIRGAALTAPSVGLVPVRVSELARPETMPVAPRPISSPRRPGLIEIETSSGIRIRVDEDLSLAALRRVLTVLR